MFIETGTDLTHSAENGFLSKTFDVRPIRPMLFRRKGQVTPHRDRQIQGDVTSKTNLKYCTGKIVSSSGVVKIWNEIRSKLDNAHRGY